MIKKFLYIILFLFFLFWFTRIYASSGDTCKYIEKIKTCSKNQTNPLVINDFVCVEWLPEKVTTQIILDDKFKEIDKKIEDYLDELLKSKDMCFWPDKKKDYTTCIDDIEKSLDTWGGNYNNICDNDVLKESMACTWEGINIKIASEYIKWNNWKCKSLAKTKMIVYKNIAYNILKENKYQVQIDQNKKFIQQQRTKYDNLINLINLNLSFLQRMIAKWPNKTQNCN